MSDFILLKAEIKGFRGFSDVQVVEFGNPLTLISGGNRRGKSSALNAVEWCLFGPQVAEIKYGDIRERDNWEVKNLGAAVCSVKCDFLSKSSGKRLTVTRTQGTKRNTTFSWEFEDSPVSVDETALQAFLKISPSDFVRAVHLHQEVIRTLITSRPGERKEAIDRLLGLSDLRETARSIQDQKPQEWTQLLDASMSELSTGLEIALRSKKATIEQDTSELRGMGLNDSEISIDGALQYSKSLIERLKSFGRDFRLPEPQLDAPNDLEKAAVLLRDVPGELSKFRQQNAVLQNQGDLLTKRSRIQGLKINYESQTAAISAAEKKVLELPENQRDLEKLTGRINEGAAEVLKLEDQIREVSENAEVLSAALSYFEKRPVQEPIVCPICGKSSKTSHDWQEHLKSEIESKHFKPLRDRLTDLQKGNQLLEGAKRTLEGLQQTANRERSHLSEITSKIGEELRVDFKEGDDPKAVLSSRIDALTEDLTNLDNEVKNINQRLSQFEADLRTLDRLLRVARTKTEIDKIEAISESQYFKELKAVRQECEQYAEDVELLVKALQEVTSAEADNRLTAVQGVIASSFKDLTQRPDFQGLKVASSKDGYSVELTGPSGTQEAVPILNQADLNCAALSIFVALATQSNVAHKLGFIIFDDPSQSLDRVAIGRFVGILEKVCDGRQIVVGTMDEYLTAEILKIAKKKNHYVLGEWDPKKGPALELRT